MNFNCNKSKLNFYGFECKVVISEIEIRTGKRFDIIFPELEHDWKSAIESKDYSKVRQVYNLLCNICEDLDNSRRFYEF